VKSPTAVVVKKKHRWRSTFWSWRKIKWKYSWWDRGWKTNNADALFETGWSDEKMKPGAGRVYQLAGTKTNPKTVFIWQV